MAGGNVIAACPDRGVGRQAIPLIQVAEKHNSINELHKK